MADPSAQQTHQQYYQQQQPQQPQAQVYDPQQYQQQQLAQQQQLQHHQQQQPVLAQQQQHPQQVQQYHQQQQPQPQYAQGQNAATQEWQNSLMDCGPCETCLLGTCLPCILLGKTSERMRDPTMQSYETFNNDCIIMCAITYFGCGWIYAMLKRSEIRERYGIKGDGTGDCCAAYWCACCALIQHDKEVIARTSPAAPVAQGYQPNKEGMVVPAPHQQQQQQQQQPQQLQQQQHQHPQHQQQSPLP